ADNTIVLPLGYGREVCGRVGDGVGFNTYRLRTSSAGRIARGTIEQGSGTHHIASTQNHWSMEGRTSIVRQVDLPAWRRHGDVGPVDQHDILYGTHSGLTFGERVGHSELTHNPPMINIYPNPYNERLETKPAPGAVFAKGPQYGMSIDLST